MVISIPLQVLLLGIWNLLRRGALICGGVGNSGTCGFTEYISNASNNLIVITLVSHGVYYVGTAFVFSIIALLATWRTKVVNTSI